MNRILLVAAVAACNPASADERAIQITVQYIKPTDGRVGGPPGDHLVEIRHIAAKLERVIQLPRRIVIKYRQCGEANSFYRADGTIDICHELWDVRRRLYAASGFSDVRLDSQLAGAMTFTVFHEFGHALHHELKLPLVGRYEDSVDEIATILMLRNGHMDSAAKAAYGHHLRSLQTRYRHDAWDEHGSGAQRGFAIACLLYGANPKLHTPLVEKMGIPAKRLEQCTQEYPRRVATWAALLKPHVSSW